MISFLSFFSSILFFFSSLSLHTPLTTVFFETCRPFFRHLLHLLPNLLLPCGIHLSISALLSNLFEIVIILRYIYYMCTRLLHRLICPFFFLFFYFNPTRETVLQSLRLCSFFFFFSSSLFTQGGGKRVIEAFFLFFFSSTLT